MKYLLVEMQYRVVYLLCRWSYRHSFNPFETWNSDDKFSSVICPRSNIKPHGTVKGLMNTTSIYEWDISLRFGDWIIISVNMREKTIIRTNELTKLYQQCKSVPIINCQLHFCTLTLSINLEDIFPVSKLLIHKHMLV